MIKWCELKVGQYYDYVFPSLGHGHNATVDRFYITKKVEDLETPRKMYFTNLSNEEDCQWFDDMKEYLVPVKTITGKQQEE